MTMKTLTSEQIREQLKKSPQYFPCPKCSHEAVMIFYDCYGEYYRCTICNHSFTVK